MDYKFTGDQLSFGFDIKEDGYCGETKICNKCNEELPISCFSPHSASNYLRPECKKCNNKLSKLRNELREIYGMPPEGYKCPICGGELIELSEEGSDANAPGAGSEKTDTAHERQLDTSLSDLILDAKHELDSLEYKPDSESITVEPSTGPLDFESMLSEETKQTEQPSSEPPFSIEEEVLKTIPDSTQGKEDVFVLDDSQKPFSETGSCCRVCTEISRCPGRWRPPWCPTPAAIPPSCLHRRRSRCGGCGISAA